MQEQRRLNEQGSGAQPVDGLIEGVKLAGIRIKVECERDQAKNIEVLRARRVWTPDDDEQSDTQVQQPDHSQIGQQRIRRLRLEDYLRLKGLALARHGISHIVPRL